jgi:aspartyl-tRNA(Asn)/glutamyl-tRNA(Gln) amidotransferase subunit A
MTALTDLTLVEAAQRIARREISPLEITGAYLERIQDLDSRLNCFITLTAGQAVQRARQAEQALAKGVTIGLLPGIPLAVKDLYETRGVRTTAGSTFFSEYIPEVDAAAVERLELAGAVLLGKLNMHEIALGVTNVNPHYGPCHNPWALERVSGGSSGGSAAALAAGLCLGALGTDTGGSIRIPAALCGVVGLKPTRGRVSLRGVIPLSWNSDHAGPMARRVEDVALLLQVIAGYDPRDAYSLDVAVEDYQSQLRDGVHGWRVALADDEFFNEADAGVLECVRQAGRVFEQLGATVEAVPLPGAHQAAQANGLMVVADAAAYHRDRLEENPTGFGTDVLERLNTGRNLALHEYIRAARMRTLVLRQFEQFFQDYDILLTPATPITAPLIEGQDAIAQARLLTRFTAPFNLTGLPALSLPCGFVEGLPVGLQIVARPWAEAQVLRAAYAYEQATEWHLRQPEF